MVLYTAVTSDIYELPIAVADNIQELTQMLGVSRSTIASTICQAKKGGWKRCRYHRIEIEDEE
ncbi:MAG: hypothetical protein KH366_10635 [Clostridiaceae bacterium]|nr:hypothetical protein [Clostridiaceae bacterium]